MEEVAPIYTRGSLPNALSVRGRLLSLGVALLCITPLVIASQLRPSPEGYGSHTAMGLAPCQFMRTTGLPCPSCGMTTSWTWFVRGNLAASLYVQPMGTVLAALVACCFWAALYIAVSGRPVYRLLEVIPGHYYFVPLLTFAILAWGWKIYIHLNGHDGWR